MRPGSDPPDVFTTHVCHQSEQIVFVIGHNIDAWCADIVLQGLPAE